MRTALHRCLVSPAGPAVHRRLVSFVMLAASVLTSWLGGVSGCGESGAGFGSCGAPRQPPPTALVERLAGKFVVNDTPTRFPGANAYFLVESMRRGEWEEVVRTLDVMADAGLTLVRLWAFDNHSRRGLHTAPGQFDEEGLAALDLVIAMAAARGMRVLPVLGNYWPDYGGIQAYARWAGLGGDAIAYASDDVVASYREWIAVVVGRTNTQTGIRYVDDPAIFGWELMNEPRCQGDGCSPELVATFLGALAAEVRSIDSRHMVGVGDEGFTGLYGTDAELLAQEGRFDWISLHLYPNVHEPLWGPDGGAAWAPTRATAEGVQRIDEAERLAAQWELPLLVGEMGWRGSGGDIERAAVLGALLERASVGGVDAALVWMVADEAYPDYDGYTIHPSVAPRTMEVLCQAGFNFGAE